MHNEGNLSGSAFFSLSKAPLISTSPADGQVLPTHNKILIWSCDPDTRFLLKTIFELWDYQAYLSDGAEQSFAIIESLKPSLIIVDSVLPFAAHLENIRQIRRHEISARIPIVVMSGFSQQRFKRLSLEAGANDFLVKPLDFDLLETYIKRFIETSEVKSQ